jgi:type VI secretion system secreted protein Hcp
VQLLKYIASQLTKNKKEVRMAFDAFVRIDGVPGESLDSEFKNWIEIKDFNVGAVQSSSALTGTSGGASTGRTHLSDFFFRKALDSATPKLHESCWTGKHFKEVTIAVNRAGGEKVKYLEIKLEEVLISSVSMSGNGGVEDSFPDEIVKLNYGRIKMVYMRQARADGQAAGQVVGGWDGIANKVYA